MPVSGGPPRFCLSCDESDTNSINIHIYTGSLCVTNVSKDEFTYTGGLNAANVSKGKFSGYFLYFRGGKQRRRFLHGSNDTTVGFPARYITYCELKKTSGMNSIQLQITENGHTIFLSDRTSSNELIKYERR